MGDCTLLLQLRELVPLTLVQRPSTRNKSPYVADATLESDGRRVIVHVPSLDMGGKCAPGSRLLAKPARDRKGNLVGSNAVGKYGTPKCEFIAQLVRVEESENKSLGGVWVGAHPKLGENLARALVEQRLLSGMADHVELLSEVRGIAGERSRADFVLVHGDA